MTNDQPKRVIRRNWAGACQESRDLSRLPAGHPEGFLRHFNVYRAFADAIHDTIKGNVPTQEYPGVQDGISEMVFLETLLKNAASKESGLQSRKSRICGNVTMAAQTSFLF